MKTEEIYLLFCLAVKYEEDEKFTRKTSEIAKDFGVTQNTVSALLSTLKARGSILVEEVYTLKGRGQYCYTLTACLLKEHKLMNEIISTQNPVILHLLKNNLFDLIEDNQLEKNTDDSNPKRSPFRASNRLFLILLLLHSDDLGVVKALSSTLIRKMMGGISVERFKSQLSTLQKFGLIKRHVSGITGKELFGRTKGSYYLNIEHPYLQESFSSVNLLSLDFNGTIHPFNESTEVQSLFDAYRPVWDVKEQKVNTSLLEQYRWPSVISDIMKSFPTKLVIHFFRNKALHDQMHQWVYDVASELIQHPCKALDEVFINELSDELVGLLSLDKSAPQARQDSILKSQKMTLNANDKIEPSQFLSDVLSFDANGKDSALLYWQHVALTRLILELGLDVALRYKRLLKLSRLDVSEVNRCVIVPMPTQGRFCFSHQIQFLSKEPFKAKVNTEVDAGSGSQIHYWLTNELTGKKERIDVPLVFTGK
ncbi:hypothetical protein ISX50_06360 [Vibrio cyclitrophicus]|nr:hypothetical protein [Vibrio cyclitrophicus]UPR35641.1 hypothetical protein ISX50_06360 [Vibrio cyclitrophicus]